MNPHCHDAREMHFGSDVEMSFSVLWNGYASDAAAKAARDATSTASYARPGSRRVVASWAGKFARIGALAILAAIVATCIKFAGPWRASDYD